jgi:hypothetical protein
VDSANAAEAGESLGPSQHAPPPMGRLGSEAPDPMWVKTRIDSVFFQIKGRRSGVLQELYRDLRLETASPQKLREIVHLLDCQLRDPNSKQRGFNLKTDLLVRISDWERERDQ